MPKSLDPEASSGPGSDDKCVILNLALKQVQGLRFQNLILDLGVGIWILKFGFLWS